MGKQQNISLKSCHTSFHPSFYCCKSQCRLLFSNTEISILCTSLLRVDFESRCQSHFNSTLDFESGKSDRDLIHLGGRSLTLSPSFVQLQIIIILKSNQLSQHFSACTASWWVGVILHNGIESSRFWRSQLSTQFPTGIPRRFENDVQNASHRWRSPILPGN